MAWSCGIVGLPNAGKSTLFKAITALDVTIESYPFSTIDPNKAAVPLQDRRLETLAAQCASSKITPAVIQVVDVAGLVKGASRGEGLGNQFLGELREADLLIHVVAGFDCGFDPKADLSFRAAIVNIELGLADLDTVSKRKQKVLAKSKSGAKQAFCEAAFLDRLAAHLNYGAPARLYPLRPEEKAIYNALFLLTAKQMIYVLNQPEENLTDAPPATLARLAEDAKSPVFTLCARLEAEIAELPAAERAVFLDEYGLKESRVQLLLKECYNLLGLITFYTVKGTEARAWIVPAGTRAIEAAAKVHSDMARGFINVEVLPWEGMLEAGSTAGARDRGFLRVEGRDYPVRDGDVLLFRFRN